ncbi:MAG: hypothetical protein JSW52_11625 [Candidatus Coatesbacteria bacterium]|nr:MAG: hypothetical protein JSW52_11625 [Candidatus Coatesbacteria bacterium]
MDRLTLAILFASAFPASAGLLGQAGDILADGDADGAEALIERYVAADPSGYLANDALEALYLIRAKGVAPEASASFLYGLDALDGGDEATARERLTKTSDDDELPWAVRGRAAVLTARLTHFDVAVDILMEVWEEADDPEVRKAAAIALAGLYREEGREEDAAGIAGEYADAFPEGPELFGVN